MTNYPRLRMRLSLAERDVGPTWHALPIDPALAPALGALMLAAYRGTVDDEGETEENALAEVERTLSGEYGLPIPDASLAISDDHRLVGASIVTMWEEHPFLAYAFVHPDAQRRGVATHLMAAAGNALLSAGHDRLDLFVTEANTPAVTLYRKLGFEVVDRLI